MSPEQTAPPAPAPKGPSNLALRLLSAAVLLPIAIAAFIVGGWWLKGLALIASAAAFFEYGAVVAKKDNLARALLMVVGLFTTVTGTLVGTDGFPFKLNDAAEPIVALIALQFAFVTISALFVLRPGTDLVIAFRNVALLVFGVVWIAPGMISISRLRDLGNSQPAVAAGAFLLTAMVATWGNDTCAYFAGRFLGKHKMAGPISPKKTWEGFVGGAIGTPLFLLAARALFPNAFAPVSTIDILVVSLPVAFLGPVGDLAESLWKRAYDVKDSGNLIPGHGGMLDRVDAVFFVAPWVLGYFVALQPLLQ